MYKCVLFDMDGTLVNSFEGIYRAYRTAFEKTGRPFPGAGFVKTAIGAPLPYAFRRLAGFSEQDTNRAVFHYREYYRRKGMKEASAYEGIKDLLKNLKRKNICLGTATLKKEEFAGEMLKYLDLYPFFDVVCGADENDSITKAGLIHRAVAQTGSDPENTLLIGDTVYDAEGAWEAGVNFLAVTYGFGFKNPGELRHPGITGIADSVSEIARQVIYTE
ncbi:MAG: HAD hydrolase-like protein [Ruminococcus sp.]|jgi:phosphoglycolate phosphatase